MSEELKPCPFCGSKAELLESLSIVFITCSDCGADSAMSYQDSLPMLTKENTQLHIDEAVKAWNTRTKEN